MTAITLRSIAERKLRSTLTAIAIMLGVAMIAGTYVQTDQIRTAFTEIEQSINAGVDADITPKTAFTTNFSPTQLLPERLVAQAAAVPGVARAEGQLLAQGSLVVDGKAVEPQMAPSIVMSQLHGQFNPLQLVDGRYPRASGDIVVNSKLAADEGLRLGQRVGVTSRSGQRPARIVGIADLGGVSSIGGATMISVSLDDMQRWFKRPGQISEVTVAAASGVRPEELVRRLKAELPATLEIKTGQQTAADEAGEINDAMGFLTPALLAFAGAALLVGAFIIFNTFSITIAERAREFALLRALGATRGQILRAVIAEALLVATLASAVGLLLGLGFARGLGAMFDAAGWGIPRGDMTLATRTIVLSLCVGVGVTLFSALVPAIRATRVAPVAAIRGETSQRRSRHPRLRAAATLLIGVGGLALLAQGLLGGGPATSRLSAIGAGTMLVFVGAALSARFIVRPLAALAGWPLQRLGRTIGVLARENATRNPARTAITAAALMVGLGLVVFVAVFAAGLQQSLNGSLEDRARLDLIVTTNAVAPLPPDAQRRVEAASGVRSTIAQYFDEVQINGEKASPTTDIINAFGGAGIREAYAFDWRRGGDGDVAKLGVAGNAIVEEQFAKQHGIAVGDRFEVRANTGRRITLTAVAEYRDPMILQGLIISPADFRRVSAATDPFAFWIRGDGGDALKRSVQTALSAYPAAKVRTLEEYRDWIGGQLDQIVYLLYALLAMSLLISLFGIANSLFLSIHERTRELGMLRAIGATRRQVRQLVRYESVITAVIGGVLGTVIGVVFAWLTTYALEDLGLGFAIPAGQLAAFGALAVVVGVLGAIVPARRAARLDILRAVATGE
jgi:putative ABC transport system permease protein